MKGSALADHPFVISVILVNFKHNVVNMVSINPLSKKITHSMVVGLGSGWQFICHYPIPILGQVNMYICSCVAWSYWHLFCSRYGIQIIFVSVIVFVFVSLCVCDCVCACDFSTDLCVCVSIIFVPTDPGVGSHLACNLISDLLVTHTKSHLCYLCYHTLVLLTPNSGNCYHTSV